VSDNSYRSPRVLSVVAGIMIFIVLLVALCLLSDVIKYVGAPFLYLPSRLGLIEVVERDQIQTLAKYSQETLLEFEEPGIQVIYTDDYDLLLASIQLEQNDGNPWINVTRFETGEKIPAEFVSRGLMPYDTPQAAGRPVIMFDVPSAGMYKIQHPSKPTDISVLPDYNTGKESILFFSYLLQIGVLVLPFVLIFYRRYRRAEEKIREIKRLKHIHGEDFWKAEANRRGGRTP
jgi:hypothetical protein